MRLIDANALKGYLIKNENENVEPDFAITTSASFATITSAIPLQSFSIPSRPKLQVCQACGAPLTKTSYGFKCEYCDSIYA